MTSSNDIEILADIIIKIINITSFIISYILCIIFWTPLSRKLKINENCFLYLIFGIIFFIVVFFITSNALTFIITIY